ncbi:MAG TPA: hypothetical protein VLL52_15460 [Anaerolineae bacterium]|nr:hypothetical protein [Anaerolineae bacterium]
MIWDFNGIVIEGRIADGKLADLWRALFASMASGEDGAVDIVYEIEVVGAVPAAPLGEPDYGGGTGMAYYVGKDEVILQARRYGQLRLDLKRGRTEAKMVAMVGEDYGVFEDLLAIGLAPHLRRRGRYMVHALAATHRDKGAVLLVGAQGAGKTTTGLALLKAGWQLLANDTPLVAAAGMVYPFPGWLSASPASWRRAGWGVVDSERMWRDRADKVSVDVARLRADGWGEATMLRAILWPEIKGEGGHEGERLRPRESLAQLLPHSLEQWDEAILPAHLLALRRLSEGVAGYRWRLGPDVSRLADSLDEILADI